MELVKETEDTVDLVSLKVSLIRIKNFSALALKHLQTVEGEDLPSEDEFRERLWVLLRAIANEEENLERMTNTVVLPGVDKQK